MTNRPITLRLTLAEADTLRAAVAHYADAFTSPGRGNEAIASRCDSALGQLTTAMECATLPDDVTQPTATERWEARTVRLTRDGITYEVPEHPSITDERARKRL